jgi:hypothetical protein
MWGVAAVLAFRDGERGVLAFPKQHFLPDSEIGYGS